MRPRAAEPPGAARADTSRRAWLAALGAGAVLGPAARRPPADDADDLAAAQRLLGLDFSAGELRQAATLVSGKRDDYAALRQHAVAPSTDVAFQFDPWPPHVPRPPAESPRPLALPAVDAARPADVDLAFAPIRELQARLRQGQVTSRQLVELALQRLERFDPELLCVVTLLREHALAVADRADEELRAGKTRGLLHGIPFGAKDLFAHPAGPTTFGAEPYREQRLEGTATVLARLEQAGAVLVAKLSLGALAMGDRWFRGMTRNPWNPAQGSSGSSAGSACATAAGLVPFALGTETLGSIVSPAVRCSVTGLRPTFGAVPRTGAMALAWTMDKVGVLARHAEDCALVFDAIRGPDGRDLSAREAGFPFGRRGDLRGLRVGILRGERVAERNHAEEFHAFLRARGVETREVAGWPDFPYAALRTILDAEAAAAFDDLTRNGGVRELADQGDRAWPNRFRAGRFVPAVEYLRATRIRTDLLAAASETLRGLDALLTPTHSGATLVCTNLTGHPALAFPVAAGERQPRLGCLIGPLFGEATLLDIACAWQEETGFHRRRPPSTS